MKKSTEGQGTRAGARHDIPNADTRYALCCALWCIACVEFMPARDSFIHSFMQAPLRPPLRLVPTTPWRVWGS